MKKYVLFLLLQGYVLKLAMAALNIKVTINSCGDYYDMEYVDDEEVYVTYDGAQLDNDECSLKFMNDRTYAKQTCIKPLNLRLDCTTKVEYHRHFIAQYLDPAVLLSCGNTSLDEYCGPTRTNNLYIVFRTSSLSVHDYASFHIYVKDLPNAPDVWDSDTSSTSSSMIVLPVVMAVVVVTIVCVVTIARRVSQRQRMQSLPRNPYVYQTTGGQMNTQTGQGSVIQAQPMTGYNPPQQPQFQPAAHGNYQMYPMQSAYPGIPQQGYGTGTGYLPVGQTDSGRRSPANMHHASALPPASEQPPPSYESVIK